MAVSVVTQVSFCDTGTKSAFNLPAIFYVAYLRYQPLLTTSPMSWITLKTTSARWEAELMYQLLAAHDIPARILDLGMVSYFGAGSPAALQVRLEDRWTALLLLSPLEEEHTDGQEP